MSGPPDPSVAARWADRAGAGLVAAKHPMDVGPDGPLEAVCFHAQQCVEKLVKAVLCRHAIPFPRSHDIALLVGLLPHGIDVPLSGVEQDTLTDYAVTARYPSEDPPITYAEAEDAVHWAVRVQHALLALMVLASDEHRESPTTRRRS
ncbi:MAG: HEPN domain-containing protein [Armatimonadetes bacterium]|nr:HEPN domain-containing protein [Armatimonadota bacterium]